MLNFPILFSYGQYVGKGSACYFDTSMNVAGAGTAAVNGSYALDKWVNGRPRFTLTTGARDFDEISWTGTEWVILSGGVSMYESTEDVTWPYKSTAGSWNVTGGAGPEPTVLLSGATGAAPATWGTQLTVDRGMWQSDLMDEMNPLQATSFGDVGNSGYTEGCKIEHIRLEGLANFDECVVAGAGTVAVNGTYYRRGDTDSNPRYTLEGENTDDYSIYSTASIWSIYNAGTEMYKQSTTTTIYLYPWQVPSWVVVSGAASAPTVQGGLLDNTYRSSGIGMWSAGSVSKIQSIFTRNFNNHGILLADKSTPATLVNISTFLNNESGVGIEGAGGMVTIMGIEGDDNPTLILCKANNTYSPGSPGSCALHVFGAKLETGPAEARPFPKGQALFDGTGWINAIFSGVQYSSVYSYPEVLIRVDGSTNSSYVSVDGLKVFGYVHTLMHDVAAKKKWLLDGGEFSSKFFSAIHSFKWIGNQNGRLITDFIVAREIGNVADDRLAWLTADDLGAIEGSWDQTAGTPAYVI